MKIGGAKHEPKLFRYSGSMAVGLHLQGMTR